MLIPFHDEHDQGFTSTLDSIGSRLRNHIGAVDSSEMQGSLDCNRGNHELVFGAPGSRAASTDAPDKTEQDGQLCDHLILPSEARFFFHWVNQCR
jgi:hypothetical protein